MKGLILSGGHGTRLRPLTYSQQKQLIPVANKPVLFYAIEDILACGVRDVGLIVGPNADQVEKAVRGADWGSYGEVRFEFIKQDAPKGLAHAVLTAEKWLGQDSFVMYLGDNLLKGGIVDHARAFQQGKDDASVMLCPVPDPTKFGVATLDEEGHIVRLVEKPKKPESNLALVGIYFFRPVIHEATHAIKPSWRNELEITDALQWLLDHKKTVTAAKVSGWWKDTGLAKDIIEANALILDEIEPDTSRADIAETANVKGRVRLGKGTRVLGSTVIKGPVLVGENCTLQDAYLGPYTTLGAGTTVIGSEVEDSVVLEGARLENAGRVVESLIGRGVVLRRNETNVKGTRLVIGDNSEVDL